MIATGVNSEGYREIARWRQSERLDAAAQTMAEVAGRLDARLQSIKQAAEAAHQAQTAEGGCPVIRCARLGVSNRPPLSCCASSAPTRAARRKSHAPPDPAAVPRGRQARRYLRRTRNDH
jgi:hypothetical protein